MRPIVTLIATLAAVAALSAASSSYAAGAAPPPASAPANPEAAYQALLAQAKTDPASIDWQALRFAYAARPGFTPFAQSAAKRTMFQAADKGDCAAALPAAKALIEERYIDADAHMIAAFCQENGGDPGGARLERAIGAALIHSIETGDGRTPPAAFTVIDVDEEYATLRALGLKPTSQALIHNGGHAYDAIVTTDEKGQTATYYFLVDRVLAAESAALRPGSVSEGGPPGRSP
jgi:hypothetical protein